MKSFFKEVFNPTEDRFSTCIFVFFLFFIVFVVYLFLNKDVPSGVSTPLLISLAAVIGTTGAKTVTGLINQIKSTGLKGLNLDSNVDVKESIKQTKKINEKVKEINAKNSKIEKEGE